MCIPQSRDSNEKSQQHVNFWIKGDKLGAGMMGKTPKLATKMTGFSRLAILENQTVEQMASYYCARCQNGNMNSIQIFYSTRHSQPSCIDKLDI